MGAAPLLTILRDGATLRSVSIEGDSLLGRSEGCVIRLEDRAISRKHAMFRPLPEGVQVERQSEFAPLKINGAECTHAIVKEGDIIEIGPYLLRLSMPSATGDAARGIADEARGQDAPSSDHSDAVASGAHVGDPPPAGELSPPIGLDSVGIEGGLSALPLPASELDPLAEMSPGGLSADAVPLADGGVPELMPGLDDVVSEAPSLSPAVAEDSATRVTLGTKLVAKLKFRPGEADVEEYEIHAGEIVLGRGKGCDVVLKDKKSSRKNTLIRRDGISFLIKDLDSSNGTYVNGEKISGEVRLESGAKVRIGEVEFEFNAINTEYEAGKGEFLALSLANGEIPADSEPVDLGPISMDGGFASPQLDAGLAFDSQLASPAAPISSDQMPALGLPAMADPMGMPGAGVTPGGYGGIPGLPGMGGIPGVAGSSGPPPKTLIGKGLVWLRAQPKPRQYMVTFLIITALGLFLFDEEEEPAKAPPKKGAQTQQQGKTGAKAGDGKALSVSFEALSSEQKKFVETQHALAFEHYRNKEYDRALFELSKIFSIVNDYKDAREIERYSREGKRKREAIEEEKRRQEDEARLKAKIAQLEEETRSLMTRKRYEQARELFAQILAIDPENKAVDQWRQEIQMWEEHNAAEAQRKKVQAEVAAQAWRIYLDALNLKKAGRYHSAIKVFGRAIELAPMEAKLVKLARAHIRKSLAAIAAAYAPVIEEARQADSSGEAAKAYALFRKASRIDPNQQEPYTAMERIRAILHEKAKVLYTEAVLAESYSDFASARKRYQEIIESIPAEDLYHERATRKLARYLKQREDIAQ